MLYYDIIVTQALRNHSVTGIIIDITLQLRHIYYLITPKKWSPHRQLAEEPNILLTEIFKNFDK